MAEVEMKNLYENLPDNSHTGRSERKVAKAPEGKRVEKVIKGKAKVKKNEIRKLTDILIAEDVSNVKNYIVMDVIVPAIKKAIYDLVVGSLDMSLYGGRGSGKRYPSDRVSYRDYNSMSRRDERPYDNRRSTTGYNYDDIVVDTRGQAESVLSLMDEVMEEYGHVRVADLYDSVGITGNYTDNDYGWHDIQNARIVRTPDGYKIKMPRAVPLKK